MHIAYIHDMQSLLFVVNVLRTVHAIWLQHYFTHFIVSNMCHWISQTDDIILTSR